MKKINKLIKICRILVEDLFKIAIKFFEKAEIQYWLWLVGALISCWVVPSHVSQMEVECVCCSFIYFLFLSVLVSIYASFLFVLFLLLVWLIVMGIVRLYEFALGAWNKVKEYFEEVIEKLQK